MLFVAVGYEVFALPPPFAKNYADVSERWVGMIWTPIPEPVTVTPLTPPLDLAPERL